MILIRFVACTLLLLLAGCSSLTPTAKRPALVAVAVSITDAHAPTPGQLATIHRAIAPVVAARGLTIAQSPEAADYVLAVRFAPDRVTGDAGHVTVIGIEPQLVRRGSSTIDRMKAEADAVHQRMSVPTP
jgi:hypothetical protein